ncbi:MAG TPA: TolC family protein [Pseudosphingobacterium sp.]|nr:TolC family protein [Pseudosphingobacterium sp.]
MNNICFLKYLNWWKLACFLREASLKQINQSGKKKNNTVAMKWMLVICFLLMQRVATVAQDRQDLTLEACYEQAKANYPLIKKRALINKSKEYSLENAEKGYLPQLSINGQATYQSAVTEIPIAVPGVQVPQLKKDQYKIYGEINQSIYDGGEIKQLKETHRTVSAIEEQRLEIELYQLKERINQLFFGILLIQEQLQQNSLLIKDINLGLSKIQGAIDNGTALKSNADVLKAERLNALQQTIDMKSRRKAYIEMLGLFMHQSLDTAIALVKPTPILATSDIKRPELGLFNYQLHNLDVQENAINARNRPKLDFFFQGGYGRPALNILKPGFEAYYIGGVRVRWNIAGLYTLKKEKAILENDRIAILADKETFLFNTNYQMKQEQAVIDKYSDLLKSDDEIIALREKVKSTSIAQLEHGVITTSDYLREVNAEDEARQNKIVHEIQLLLSQYNNKYTQGN